ncbi:MAG: hypothetical protein K0R44_26 [Thermomicrobiales bacterium]|jgi:hypothetical protein|nr:hypothetical protein [Thermomicrobiales bacterium]MDF3014801.1 hypothetical protein [Thermomicrobiales bacterium]
MALPNPRRSTATLTRPTGQESTYAAREIRISDPNEARYLHTLVSATKNHFGSSHNPWDWFEKLGEVHYAVARAARIAGYTELFAEYEQKPGVWVRRDTGREAAIVDGIYSPFGGVRGLISRYFTLMKVPADSHLIRVKNGGVYDGYHFMSVDEIDQASLDEGARRTGGATEFRWRTLPISDEGNTSLRTVAAEDYLGRVWAPSDRWVDLPDSPLFALDTECEVLHLSTLSLRAKLASRFASAGILFIPQSMRSAAWAHPDNGVNEGVSDAARIDDVLDSLIKSMTRNQLDYESAKFWLPLLVSGPDDVGEKIKHILIDSEVFETDLSLRREMIDRIFTGLDIQANATKGVGEESSRFNAWSVSDDELRLVAKPDVEAACWAFTRLILHKQLKEAGVDDAQIVKWRVGFDMNRAASKTNQQDDARQIEDRGGLKLATLRSVSGFDEDDAPEEQEQIRWMGRQTRNPYLGLFTGKKISEIDWDMVLKFSGKSGPTGKAGDDPTKGPGVGNPGSPDTPPED